MKRLLAAHGRPVTVGILALLGAAAGGAYAATNSDRGGVIVACAHHKDGELYRASRCAADDAQLSWNVRGPQGTPGRRGRRGNAGWGDWSDWAKRSE